MNNTKKLIQLALFSALIYIGTSLHIEIPIGAGVSMVHLGTTVIFIVAVLIGKDAWLPSAIGCALMDLLNPAFALWTLPTFIIKGATGYVTGKVAFLNGKEGSSTIQNTVGFVLGGLVSLFGYFLCNWLIFKGWQGAVSSLLTSITTTTIGLVIAIPLSMAVKVAAKKFIYTAKA